MYKTAIIQGCIQVESSAASVYSNLMQIFPDREEFWGSLLNDEKEHVTFLNDVKSLGLSEDIEKVDLLPTLPMIDRTLKFVEDVNKKIRGGTISFKDALSMTLKIEESMVETYTNKVVNKLLICAGDLSCERFVEDEKSHVEKIKSMMHSE